MIKLTCLRVPCFCPVSCFRGPNIFSIYLLFEFEFDFRLLGLGAAT